MSQHPHQSTLHAGIPQQNLLLCLHLPRYIRGLFCGSFLRLDFFSLVNCGNKTAIPFRQICGKTQKDYQFSSNVCCFSGSIYWIKPKPRQTNICSLLTKSRLLATFKSLPGILSVQMETGATAFPLAAASFRTPSLVETMQSVTLRALDFSWTLKAPWFMQSLLVLCSSTMKTLARALNCPHQIQGSFVEDSSQKLNLSSVNTVPL